MANERKTENIVRNKLRSLGYYVADSQIQVEEQQSDIPKIKKLLKTASKKGHGIGYPEFIITSTTYPDLLIVIECKAETSKHESSTKDKYAEYAVDGSLLYASFLSKDYDVITIGVSGVNEKELKVTHHLFLKGQNKYEPFLKNDILSFSDYYNSYIQTPTKFSEDYKSLLNYSEKLNKLLHSKKVKESQRSLLISGILIGIKNKAFRTSYKKHTTAQHLTQNLVATIVNELFNTNLPATNLKSLKSAFLFIQNHSTLSTDKIFLEDLITNIDNKLNSFLGTYKYFDALGKFYIEFLRYANDDKGLGIVLTPPHITELFVELVGVNKNSVVLDNCCGTGGFIISAMKKMVKDAGGDSTVIDGIKKNQVIGIEFQDDIYALAITNMIIHGDGKSNIFQGDCFRLVKKIKEVFKPTVGFLNPPYPSEKQDINELNFVLNNLEMLERNGKCIAIVPMSCATANSGKDLQCKELLLKHHTLEAVMSMPDELFHGQTSVISCIMVFTAHIPHPKHKKTWFSYWKDDGFVKKRGGLGRIDYNNSWEIIWNSWVGAFYNRNIEPEVSIMKNVLANDEWCAEAYLETNFTKVRRTDFIANLKEYCIYLFSSELTPEISKDSILSNEYELKNKKSSLFKIGDYFDVYSGSDKPSKNDAKHLGGELVNSIENQTTNNGVKEKIEFIDKSKIFENFVSVVSIGDGGKAFYQPERSVCFTRVKSLVPKEKYVKHFSKYVFLFFATMLDMERYRYGYGRVVTKERLSNTLILLPSVGNEIDFDFIEKYIKTLPYSASL